MTPARRRIGFVATRLAGMDGVSLETAKWVKVLEASGCTCFFFAGACEWPHERSQIVAEAHFDHPTIRQISSELFDDFRREPATSHLVEVVKAHLKSQLYEFVRRFEIEELIVENAWAIPMNVPLGLALTELIAETGIPAIGHHHDFYWERARFLTHAADDYLAAAFPPTLREIHHVVISSFAQRQLAIRTGVVSMVVPNVMDFDAPPQESPGPAYDLRATLGIGTDEYFLLQPTRIVPRKRIERSIELARRLGIPCALVISHAAGDEGAAYADYLREYVELLGVHAIFAEAHFGAERTIAPDGRKIYSLADGYHSADLVTYPSAIEGFGNAFLEAVYYRRPILMGAYDIYLTDIHPKGFQVITFTDFLSHDVLARTRVVLENLEIARAMAEHNYALARQHYSFAQLELRLPVLLSLAS